MAVGLRTATPSLNNCKQSLRFQITSPLLLSEVLVLFALLKGEMHQEKKISGEDSGLESFPWHLKGGLKSPHKLSLPAD